MLQLAETKTAKNELLHPQGQTRVRPAADLVGVNYQTLRRWWREGKFPKPIDINGILLFRNADLLNWLESHKPSADNDQESATQTQGA